MHKKGKVLFSKFSLTFGRNTLMRSTQFITDTVGTLS